MSGVDLFTFHFFAWEYLKSWYICLAKFQMLNIKINLVVANVYLVESIIFVSTLSPVK